MDWKGLPLDLISGLPLLCIRVISKAEYVRGAVAQISIVVSPFSEVHGGYILACFQVFDMPKLIHPSCEVASVLLT